MTPTMAGFLVVKVRAQAEAYADRRRQVALAICRRSSYVMARRRKLDPFGKPHYGDKSRGHQQPAK